MAMVMVKKAPAKKPATKKAPAKKPAVKKSPAKKASTVVVEDDVGIGALCGTGLALAKKPAVKKSPAKRKEANREGMRIDIPLSITQTSD